jgi:multidrug efflux system membrane fusion protein
MSTLRVLVLASVLAAASLAAAALAGCHKSEAPPSFDRPPAPVTVTPSTSRDVPIYLDEIGKAVAREMVAIQPQVSGRITQIHFADGADVKKGDALFTIDPRPYQAKLDAAAASVARQKAVLELAKVEFGRFEKLAGTKAISESDYDTKKNAIALAEAQLLQNQAALDAARIDLDYCSILSPIDGRAGQRLVDQGNVVNAGSGTLLVIQRLDPIYADFSVPEGDLSSVQSAMARGKLRAEVRFPDDPNDPREGELTFLDNAVVDGTGMVKLRATIPNGDLHFWPGRFVKVRLVLSHLEGAVLVSTQAPQTSATGSFVYVVKPDSTAEMRPIVLGQRHGDFIVVTSGLQAGERVVVTGQLGIMPGGKVRIDEPSAPPHEVGSR